MISSRKTLKSIGDSKLHCRTPNVVMKSLPRVLLNRTELVELLYSSLIITMISFWIHKLCNADHSPWMHHDILYQMPS